MKRSTILSLLLALAAGLVGVSAAVAAPGRVGAAYTMTNAPGGNEILAYDRLADGSLGFAGAYDTGGLGSGDGLGNQGGVVLSCNKRWLLVVNAGSDQFSVFQVRRADLKLQDVAYSGGRQPVSVALSKDLVYVVHAGGSVGDADSLFGFRLGRDGFLTPLAGSSTPLSAPATGPAQVGFSPDGRFFLVSEKATNRLHVFPVDEFGYLGAGIVNPSEGQTPFAFGFGPRDLLFVSEVFGGAVSSYRLQGDGSLATVDASVPNTETAPCWLVVTKGGRYVFTTNTPDDSLSAYAVDFDGRLDFVDADGRTGEPGPGTLPLDMDLSDDGRFLFTLNIGNGTISTFRVLPDGGLDPLAAAAGLPAGVNGLAVL
jgi:6-phosphogluconolactonase